LKRITVVKHRNHIFVWVLKHLAIIKEYEKHIKHLFYLSVTGGFTVLIYWISPGETIERGKIGAVSDIGSNS
jgi:lipid-A-disaccharide synthase-like uncharacterized protein